MIEPFRLSVKQEQLDDLRDRLARVRWPDELPGPAWRRGVPRDYLRALVAYWRDDFDWRAQEERINEHPQFVTEIDGALVHFIHARSPEPDALPLIITHGWPGSIVEFRDVIGPLVDPRAHGGDPATAFHVVAPSIPGFGLSGPTGEAGWDVRRIAAAWKVLMTRLGYEQFGAQGGDWGSRISWQLGLDADGVLGVHVNMLSTAVPEDGTFEPTADEQHRINVQAEFARELSGYMKLQSTRPQTLAYALSDSPVGQLAWIVEKFKEWTDSSDRPEDAVDRDQMLTNVMLYWLTGTAGSAANLYYEFARGNEFGPPDPTTTPTGVAVFARDIVKPIRRIAEVSSNVTHWSEFDRGGHFAAMEQPELLVEDIRMFFRNTRIRA